MKLILLPGEIHLWRARVTDAVSRCGELQRFLSPNERHRAGEFRFACHRDAYIAARGMLRELLASYAGLAPGSLVFHYGEFGKPCLHNTEGLYFNLSHSDEWIVYALAREERVGVDIERTRQLPEALNIAKEFFAASEHGDDFFRRWTRNEAYLKALGRGLGLAAEEPPGSEWTRFDFTPAAGYAGAVAIYGDNWVLREVADWRGPKSAFGQL